MHGSKLKTWVRTISCYKYVPCIPPNLSSESVKATNLLGSGDYPAVREMIETFQTTQEHYSVSYGLFPIHSITEERLKHVYRPTGLMLLQF